MTDYTLIGWRASNEDVALIAAIRKKTDETTTTAVLRKAIYQYARAHGIKVPA
jgi:hypothetical protein